MLVGIQGSGKGTQARKISEKFGYKIFDTGAELRKISATNTELGQKIKKIIESGNYVPSDYIADTIKNFIKNNKDFPIIFDGPIRSQEQDTIIRPILGNVIIIHLLLDSEIAINRLTKRRIDPETGEIFGENFEGNINPKTGNTLVQRNDDTIDTIKKRIQWSTQESLPLIENWKKDGYTVYELDAKNDIENIFENISQLLISLKK